MNVQKEQNWLHSTTRYFRKILSFVEHVSRQHPLGQFLERAEGSGGRVEGGVPPLREVNLGQDSALARNSRVDLVVGQDHGVDLNAVHLVSVITNDS